MRCLNKGDELCVQLIVEEGVFIQRVRDQSRRYPQSASYISLLAMSPIAMIAHDAIPFINRAFGLRLSAESPRIASMRHLSKFLDSQHLDYAAYAAQVGKIRAQLKGHFKHFSGVLALINEMAADVGIAYYKGRPAYATYGIAHYMTVDDASRLLNDGGAFSQGMGYEASEAVSFLFDLAGQSFDDESLFCAPELILGANDFHFDKLAGSLEHYDVKDEAVFFFLSEILVQMTLMDVLYLAGFYTYFVWLKFAIATLCHAEDALRVFSSYTYKQENQCRYSDDFRHALGCLFGKGHRKKIKKMKRLRNALVHYDFESDLVAGAGTDAVPMETLAVAVREAMGMNLDEFNTFLADARAVFVSNLGELIDFPAYDPGKNQF